MQIDLTDIVLCVLMLVFYINFYCQSIATQKKHFPHTNLRLWGVVLLLGRWVALWGWVRPLRRWIGTLWRRISPLIVWWVRALGWWVCALGWWIRTLGRWIRPLAITLKTATIKDQLNYPIRKWCIIQQLYRYLSKINVYIENKNVLK